MQCSKCRNEAIIFQPYSGQYLCQNHLILDIETKARRTLRRHQWMRPGDHIAVPLTGNPAENALLFFLRKLARRRKDIQISGILVEKNDMDIVALTCDLDITRIALATSLEEASASVLTAILVGDTEHCIAADSMTPGPIPVINPFRHIPAEEIAAYARINGMNGEGRHPLPQKNDPIHRDVASMLADFTRRHPAAPYAVLNLCDDLGGAECRDLGTDSGPEESERDTPVSTEQLKKIPR